MKIAVGLIIPFLGLCFSTAHSWAGENQPLRLEEVVGEALDNNPELKAAENNIEALAERPDQASSLPNPMLSLGLMNLPLDTLDIGQEGMTQKTIGVMQSFPYPGKLALRREIAERDLTNGKEGLEAIKLRVVKEIKNDYYSLFFTNKSIDITERNRRLLQEFIRIAETKYSVGSGVQQDVLKAQVELSKLLEKLIALKENRNILKARLNYLMNHMPQAPLGDPADISLTIAELSVDDLQQKAESSHPLLRGIMASIERSRSANLLARKEYYPDFNVSLQYGQREDGGGMERPDFASAMVQVQLPLWHRAKEERKVLETAARIRQMEQNYETAKSMLFFRITKLKEEIGRNYEQALLFRDGIIPQATASLDSAVAGYQVNKVDFLTLLNNQITLLNFEIEYYRTVADHESKLAELEEAVGVSISGLKKKNADNAGNADFRR